MADATAHIGLHGKHPNLAVANRNDLYELRIIDVDAFYSQVIR